MDRVVTGAAEDGVVPAALARWLAGQWPVVLAEDEVIPPAAEEAIAACKSLDGIGTGQRQDHIRGFRSVCRPRASRR
jgi:hypothetical protein